MEELIPLLLFVIFSIITALGKARNSKKRKKAPKAGRRKGLVARFISWLFDLQKRIEDQAKKAPKGDFDWEEILRGSKPQSRDTKPQDIDPDPLEEAPSSMPEPASATMPPPSPYRSTSPQGKPGIEAANIPRTKIKTGRKTMPRALPTNRADLRQAIVWSEIIGPPVALRDPSGDHR